MRNAVRIFAAVFIAAIISHSAVAVPIGARTIALGEAAAALPKYVGIDANNNTPFSFAEFVGQDFELVVSGTSNPSWTYANFRQLVTNGETGAIVTTPVGIGLYEGYLRFASRDSDNSSNIIFINSSTGFYAGTEQSFKFKKVANVYTASVSNGDTWIVLGSATSSKFPLGKPLKIGRGSNPGWYWLNGGTISLNKSYLVVGNILWWEGEYGAYKNINP